MKLNCTGISLISLAKYRQATSFSQIVSLGLLIDAEGNVVPPEVALPWLVERFGGQPFDRGLKKSRATFAVHGSAFALSASQQQGMAIQVQIGLLEKMLHIFPPRQWRKGLLGWKAVVTEPLYSVEVDFAHAFGGAGWPDNPDGCGYISGSPEEGIHLPQIEVVHEPLFHPQQFPSLASLLPLPPQCHARQHFMGTLDLKWQQERHPYLPLDTDNRWFDEVAQDQCQEEYWRGDEYWQVAGMHSKELEISGYLPALRPRLFVEQQRDEVMLSEAKLDLDTVWLFPDIKYQLLFYRAELLVVDIDGDDLLTLAVVCERLDDTPRQAADWIKELWPVPVIETPQVKPEVVNTSDDAANNMLINLQTAADEIYDILDAEYDKGIQLLKETMAKVGKILDPLDYPPLSRPKFVLNASSISPPMLDMAALKESIQSELAQAEAEGLRHLTQIAKKLNYDPAQLLAPPSAAMLAKNQAMIDDPALIIGHCPSLTAAQKSTLQTEIRSGIAEMHAMEENINSQINALNEKITAHTPSQPMVLQPISNVWTRPALEAAYMSGGSLHDQHFIDLDLSGIELSGADLQGCQFSGCQLNGSRLTRSILNHCIFEDCQLEQVDLQQANLTNATLQRSQFIGANLQQANLQAIYAAENDFSEVNLCGVQGNRAYFSDCKFNHAQVSKAKLSAVSFLNCHMDEINLANSHLPQSQFTACRMDNAKLNGVNLQAARWCNVKGSDIHLSDSYLCDLRIDQGCCLTGVCMDRANLHGASMQQSSLRGASLRSASLINAFIVHCDLSHSDGYRLDGRCADFSGSNLSQASWVAANLMDASLRKVCLQQIDLRASHLFAADVEGVYGHEIKLQGALLTQCRLLQELNNGT